MNADTSFIMIQNIHRATTRHCNFIKEIIKGIHCNIYRVFLICAPISNGFWPRTWSKVSEQILLFQPICLQMIWDANTWQLQAEASRKRSSLFAQVKEQFVPETLPCITLVYFGL